MDDETRAALDRVLDSADDAASDGNHREAVAILVRVIRDLIDAMPGPAIIAKRDEPESA